MMSDIEGSIAGRAECAGRRKASCRLAQHPGRAGASTVIGQLMYCMVSVASLGATTTDNTERINRAKSVFKTNPVESFYTSYPNKLSICINQYRRYVLQHYYGTIAAFPLRVEHYLQRVSHANLVSVESILRIQLQWAQEHSSATSPASLERFLRMLVCVLDAAVVYVSTTCKMRPSVTLTISAFVASVRRCTTSESHLTMSVWRYVEPSCGRPLDF